MGELGSALFSLPRSPVSRTWARSPGGEFLRSRVTGGTSCIHKPLWGKSHTIAKSLRGVKLKKGERADLERYIDVTRGELFFSKGVILVEGDAERFLLPTLAKLYDPAMDFDALGISVCSIAGTNFGPYVQLLGPAGLDIPFVVLTDYDPKGQPVSQEDADPDAETGESYGKNRVVNQIMRRLIDDKEWDKLSFDEVLEKSEDNGIFLNKYTFEIDLFNAGTEDEFAEAIKGLTDNKKMHERFDKFAEDPKTLDPKSFLKDIDSLERPLSKDDEIEVSLESQTPRGIRQRWIEKETQGEQQVRLADLVLTENNSVLSQHHIQRFEVAEVLDNDSAQPHCLYAVSFLQRVVLAPSCRP